MRRLSVLLVICLLAIAAHARAQSNWPRSFEAGRYTITMYAPEVVSIDDPVVSGRAAFSIASSDTSMVFGALSFDATFAEVEPPALRLQQFEITAFRVPDSLVQYQDTIAATIKKQVLAWEIETTRVVP